MNKPRMLFGLLLTVSALSVFAPPASATTITSNVGTTPTIEASSEGAITFDGVLDITCNQASFKATVETHGTGLTAKGNNGSLSISECGDDHFTVLKLGSLEIHATDSGDGTVTFSGTEFTIAADSIFGTIHCIWTTSATHIGTLTGASGSTGHSTLHIDSAEIPRTGGKGGGLCGNSSELTGSFDFTDPTGLVVE